MVVTRVVAIDTSTWWGGVALLEDAGEGPRVVAEAGVLVSGSHAASLLTVLDPLLAVAGWTRESAGLYAAARGPGSFTGLRIGLGTARGLALAAGRPAVGVGTLDAFAVAFGEHDTDRVPLLDAGRGELFGARFDGRSFPPIARVPPWVGPVEAAVEPGNGEAVLFGPGVDRYRERLEAIGARDALRVTPRGIAAAVGRLALYACARGVADGWDLSPLYVRPPDAVVRAEPT